jgi:hypothetical protein
MPRPSRECDYAFSTMASDIQPGPNDHVTCSNCRQSMPETAAQAAGWGVVREGQTVTVALCDDCITALLDAE